ncbi:hypothetical protein LXL04_014438 [Taraxacum kok-saghyz]
MYYSLLNIPTSTREPLMVINVKLMYEYFARAFNQNIVKKVIRRIKNRNTFEINFSKPIYQQAQNMKELKANIDLYQMACIWAGPNDILLG